jgi:hypothetical protein
MKYEIVKDERTGAEILKRIDTDGKIWWIPMEDSNSDYQAYLNPAEQSTPNLPN